MIHYSRLERCCSGGEASPSPNNNLSEVDGVVVVVRATRDPRAPRAKAYQVTWRSFWPLALASVGSYYLRWPRSGRISLTTGQWSGWLSLHSACESGALSQFVMVCYRRLAIAGHLAILAFGQLAGQSDNPTAINKRNPFMGYQ